MHKRVDAGTDVAMVGAWDAGKQELHLSSAEQKHIMATLENDASQGYLFLIHTGGDGGGPIDIYIDTEVPLNALKGARPLSGEYLVAVPSGRLVVAGVEEYRAPRDRLKGDCNIVTIPAGDYALRCHIGPDEDETPVSEDKLKEMIGAGNLRAFDRATYIVVGIGFAIFVVVFLGLAIIGLTSCLSLPISLAVLFGYALSGNLILRCVPVHRRFGKVIEQFRLGNQPPTFIFELRRVTDRTGLKGGSVRP